MYLCTNCNFTHWHLLYTIKAFKVSVAIGQEACINTVLPFASGEMMYIPRRHQREGNAVHTDPSEGPPGTKLPTAEGPDAAEL